MESENIIYTCPHCENMFVVNKKELNCKIIRHGCCKNMKPIDPHLPKEECDELFEKKMIYGCGKPVKIDESGNATKCDYI